jgi:hypothetical protein
MGIPANVRQKNRIIGKSVERSAAALYEMGLPIRYFYKGFYNQARDGT